MNGSEKKNISVIKGRSHRTIQVVLGNFTVFPTFPESDINTMPYRPDFFFYVFGVV